jgi:hypothetical protein
LRASIACVQTTEDVDAQKPNLVPHIGAKFANWIPDGRIKCGDHIDTAIVSQSISLGDWDYSAGICDQWRC